MAIIAQKNLFSWREIDAASDLERLNMVLSVVPDEPFMQFLEGLRGKGRNDYPVRAMWNALLAGVVFQHPSAASLIRELRRNRELAEVCGFDPLKGLKGIPSEDAFGRFLGKVVRHLEQVLGMFEKVVEELAKAIPDLGMTVAIDSKALPSFGREVKDPCKKGKQDGRRDTDGDRGVKVYRGRREDGSNWEKVITWFGYKLHLIVDSRHEIPLAFSVTKASRSDVKEGRSLFRRMREGQPEVFCRIREAAADRGYDCGKLCAELFDDYGIYPVIDTRRMWREEVTRPLFAERVDTMIYDERGQVFCVCPCTGEVREMAFMGFEKDRRSLKYRCPAAAYGLECKGRRQCEALRKIGPFGRVVRVPLKQDRRIFTPIPRHSYRWQDAFKLRTSVERVFSRLDGAYGFEHHFIRGLAKMETRVGLALLVQVCMALAWVRRGQVKQMRSLVKPLARAA